MNFSNVGEKLKSGAGITQLMADLGHAMAVDKNMLMLGGGNPARIPAMEDVFRQALSNIAADADKFHSMAGTYGPPQGNPHFLTALSDMLNEQFNWSISEKNIALTNGSQTASFILFNALAGQHHNGVQNKILLPLTPEYIGYADQGLSPDIFISARPQIKLLGNQLFKYFVDFDGFEITPDIAAICVSRPTNPTGNVLTDNEIQRLDKLAEENDIPLIIDSAYGTPFPNIIFTQASPFYSANTILSMSLSKIGLPGVRTGIVIAREDIIEMLASANAVLSLTTGGVGPAMVTDLVKSGQLLSLSKTVIQPFYAQRARASVKLLQQELSAYDVYIHKPEGALFLWLWFKDLPITTQVLYEKLKKRSVLVIPGQHFFPGLAKDWDHRHQCIRITYSQEESAVNQGLKIIAEEVRNAYDNG